MRIFLVLVIVVLQALSTARAEELRAALPSLPAQNDPARVPELLRRLNLPPDPALVPPMQLAFDKSKACLRRVIRDSLVEGRDEKGIADGACHKCSNELLAADISLYNAYAYRNTGEPRPAAPDFKVCSSLQASSEVFVVASQLALDSTADKTPPVLKKEIGAWRVTEEINYQGRLIFRAAAKDKRSTVRRLEALCWPTDDNSWRVFLIDPKVKAQKTPAIITIGHANSPLDQIEVSVQDGYYEASALYLKILKAALSSVDLIFFVSAQGAAMEFDFTGAPQVFKELGSDCHLR